MSTSTAILRGPYGPSRYGRPQRRQQARHSRRHSTRRRRRPAPEHAADPHLQLHHADFVGRVLKNPAPRAVRCPLRSESDRIAARQRNDAICHKRTLAPHVWMAPAWQEIIWRAAQRSLAVMCPACWCSPGGLLALMGSANRVLIIRTGSMSR